MAIDRCYASAIESVDPTTSGKDAKTKLQEWLQAKGLPLPEYAITSVDGEAHRQVFTVSCRVQGLRHGDDRPWLQPANRGAEAASAALAALSA
jgi:ribonuclease-3